MPLIEHVEDACPTERARRPEKWRRDQAASHKAVVQYEEYLNHNEVEPACDMMEACAEGQKVHKEFWLALGDAAARSSDAVRTSLATSLRVSNPESAALANFV